MKMTWSLSTPAPSLASSQETSRLRLNRAGMGFSFQLNPNLWPVGIGGYRGILNLNKPVIIIEMEPRIH